jgi:hypothetical protein
VLGRNAPITGDAFAPGGAPRSRPPARKSMLHVLLGLPTVTDD